MGAQGASSYAHPVRTLGATMPLVDLVEHGAIKEGALHDLRRYDHLINYMYPQLAPSAADHRRRCC
jgi:hypothetical protein